MGVNVRSLYLATRAFLKTMLDAGTGTIANIASLAGKNGIEGVTPYCASKHAALGCSTSLMPEARKRGLRAEGRCRGYEPTAFIGDQGPLAWRLARGRALPAPSLAHTARNGESR